MNESDYTRIELTAAVLVRFITNNDDCGDFIKNLYADRHLSVHNCIECDVCIRFIRPRAERLYARTKLKMSMNANGSGISALEENNPQLCGYWIIKVALTQPDKRKLVGNLKDAMTKLRNIDL